VKVNYLAVVVTLGQVLIKVRDNQSPNVVFQTGFVRDLTISALN
jgi:hypothetical protein